MNKINLIRAGAVFLSVLTIAKPIYATEPAGTLMPILQEIEQESAKYNIYGFHIGMTFGEIKKIAEEKGSNIQPRLPSYRFKLDDMDIITMVPIHVKGDINEYIPGEIRISKKHPVGMPNVEAKKQEYIEKFGEPYEITKKETNLSMIYTTKSSSIQEAMKKCMEGYKKKHTLEESQALQNKMSLNNAVIFDHVEQKIRDYNEYCPNALPDYLSSLRKQIGLIVSFMIDPATGSEDIVMRYDGGGIIREYRNRLK